ncbi:uncharacterized protein LOC113381314 [Ctenocephalides felis]|uniref:uncharacterized protein LOC113381314 n=1 Tax=Ctenocephalides felis TaxID=7515 RepID=UPI000E6E37E0|nr:uncharacterized protein LOC113381314 [Ctenocephalides felis]
MAELKAKGGFIKSKLTRVQNFVNSLDSTILDENIIIELNTRLEKILPIIDEFETIQYEIELIEGVSESDKESFESDYYRTIAKLKFIIQNFNDTKKCKDDQQTIGPSSIDSYTNIKNIKLPTIKLPTFDGSYDKWLEFHDSFNALVHSDNTLSKIQKFYYLKSSLEKDAKNSIAAIDASDSNYDIAWKILKDRFENKRLIIHNHIKAIFDSPKCSRESHTELRTLLETTSRHLRSLESLGEPTDKWDTIIIFIFTNKFDTRTLRDWESFTCSKEKPTLTDINNFIKQKCDMLEKLSTNISSKPFPNNINKSLAQHIKYKSTNNNHNSSINYLSTGRQTSYLCEENHSLYYCKQFKALSIKDRISRIKELNLCINCFKRGHKVDVCLAFPCKICKMKHNTLVHFEETNTIPSTSGSNMTVANYSTKNINTKLQPQVILATAVIKVESSSGEFIECRCLLDCGAQSNFITADTCKRQEALNQAKTLHNSASMKLPAKTDIKLSSISDVKSASAILFIFISALCRRMVFY